MTRFTLALLATVAAFPFGPGSSPEPPPDPTTEPLISAGFEHGLRGWNTSGVGEVVPQVTADSARTGRYSSRVRLVGRQDRSELVLGGNGGGSNEQSVLIREGDRYWYGFSFYVNKMRYGRPGAHNLIMQLKSEDDGSPNFGLQLWDYRGDQDEYADHPKGLWSHSRAMGGERFLAPVTRKRWHDVQIYFRASSRRAGFYKVFLDGAVVDWRRDVSMIVPGAPYAYIKTGLYRNGEEIPGVSDIRLDAAKLGITRESVLP